MTDRFWCLHCEKVSIVKTSVKPPKGADMDTWQVPAEGRIYLQHCAKVGASVYVLAAHKTDTGIRWSGVDESLTAAGDLPPAA